MQYPVTIKQKDGTEKTFWLSDEKLQFGGTDSGVTDVKINGTSIVDGGVANVPVGGENGYGAVKFSSYNPFYTNSLGELQLYAAEQPNINNRNSTRPIAPANLDYAVKAALTDARKIAYTDAEKASARATIGAVALGEIPYAEGTTGGVIKVNGYGLRTNSDHYVYVERANNDQINAKVHGYNPITPANLDYAVKASLSHSTVEWMDAETAAARDVLGVGLATATKPGLIRPWNEGGGLMMDGDGVIKIYAADPERIDARIQRYAPITPYRLNYAVKAALTDANKMTMTAAEQASARETLGLEEMMVNDSDLKLVKTITLQGNETSFTETGFKYKKVALYFENVAPSDTTSSHLLRANCFGANNVLLGAIYHDNWKNQPFAMLILKKEDGLWRGEKVSAAGNGAYNQAKTSNTLSQVFDTTSKEYIEKIEFSFGVTPVAGGKIKIFASEHDDSVIAPMTKRKIYDQTLTSAVSSGAVTIPLGTSNPKRLECTLYLPQCTKTGYWFGVAVRAQSPSQQSGTGSTQVAYSTVAQSHNNTSIQPRTFEIIRSESDVVSFRRNDGEYVSRMVSDMTDAWRLYELWLQSDDPSSTDRMPIPAGTRVVVYEIGEQAVPREEKQWTLKGTLTKDTTSVDVDMTGCTELSVGGTGVATGNVTVTARVSGEQVNLVYYGLDASNPGFTSSFVDGPFGIVCVAARNGTENYPIKNLLGLSSTNGTHIKDITKVLIFPSDVGNITSCNIKIYAR